MKKYIIIAIVAVIAVAAWFILSPRGCDKPNVPVPPEIKIESVDSSVTRIEIKPTVTAHPKAGGSTKVVVRIVGDTTATPIPEIEITVNDTFYVETPIIVTVPTNVELVEVQNDRVETNQPEIAPVVKENLTDRKYGVTAGYGRWTNEYLLAGVYWNAIWDIHVSLGAGYEIHEKRFAGYAGVSYPVAEVLDLPILFGIGMTHRKDGMITLTVGG